MFARCGISLKYRPTSKELRKRIGEDAIGYMMTRYRLKWDGHVDHKGDADWMKAWSMLLVEGTGHTRSGMCLLKVHRGAR